MGVERQETLMNTSMKTSTFVLLCLLAAGCAAPVAIEKPTASGKPEVTIANAKASDVKIKVIEGCIKRGYKVDETQSLVHCDKPLEGMQAVAVQLAIGNSRSSNPVMRVSYLVTQKDADTFVMMASASASSQMSFGQVNSMEMKQPSLINGVQQFLDEIANSMQGTSSPYGQGRKLGQ